MNVKARMSRTILAMIAMSMMAVPAWAHEGHETVGGFALGLIHPLSGIDHVAAMVAVGLLAALTGGRVMWLAPTVFLGGMAIGGVLGTTGVAVPFVETGIIASIVCLAILIAVHKRTPVTVVLVLCAAFAVFHGWAHGAEMPGGADGLAYAGGFLLATAFLHGLGIVLGLGLARLPRQRRDGRRFT